MIEHAEMRRVILRLTTPAIQGLLRTRMSSELRRMLLVELSERGSL